MFLIQNLLIFLILLIQIQGEILLILLIQLREKGLIQLKVLMI